MPVFLKGIVIGFSIAAPVGPIGIICIRRTLAEGRPAGILSGMGAASADLIYGVIAAFGLTVIQSALLSSAGWLKIIGGLFLLFLGGKTFFAPTRSNPEIIVPDKGKGLLSAYVNTFFLTLTNPVTILSFIAIFSAVSVSTNTGDNTSPFLLVVGVFLGSAAWWLTLSALVSFFRSRFNQGWMTGVNRIAGAIIVAFGLAAFFL